MDLDPGMGEEMDSVSLSASWLFAVAGKRSCMNSCWQLALSSLRPILWPASQSCVSGSRGKSGAGPCSPRAVRRLLGLGEGSLGNQVQCFKLYFWLFFFFGLFLVGLHCCDNLVGCWEDVDFMEISHFCSCIFMPWSPVADAYGLAYRLKTLLL